VKAKAAAGTWFSTRKITSLLARRAVSNLHTLPKRHSAMMV
jgi:hypothetical protein